MMKIVQNSSFLRFNAPEWHPNTRKSINEDNDHEVELNDCKNYHEVKQNESMNQDEQRKSETWMMPKQASEKQKKGKVVKKTCSNKFEILGEDKKDDEVDEILFYSSEEEGTSSSDNDMESEIHSENEQSWATREQLQKEITRLKSAIKMNEEIHDKKFLKEHEQGKYFKDESQSRKEEIEFLEAENEKLRKKNLQENEERIHCWNKEIDELKYETTKAREANQHLKQKHETLMVISESLLLSNVVCTCYNVSMVEEKTCKLFASNDSQKLDEDEWVSKKENLKTLLEEHCVALEEDLDDERCEFYDRILWNVRVDLSYVKNLLNVTMLTTDNEEIEFFLLDTDRRDIIMFVFQHSAGFMSVCGICATDSHEIII